MRFESEKIGGKKWIGNRFIWNIWTADRKNFVYILNLKFTGSDLLVTSFRIGNIEYLFFNEVRLSVFQDNLAFHHHVTLGTYISLDLKRDVDLDTEIWWELED